MENQGQFRTFPLENSDQDLSGDSIHSWWEKIGDQLSLGLFVYSGQEDIFYHNAVLQDWLSVQGVSFQAESALWEKFSSLAAEPIQVLREYKQIRDRRQDNPLIQIPLKTGAGTLSIQVFFLSDAEDLDSKYGGFVFKDQETPSAEKKLVKVFDSLLVPARQITAALQGNLGALAGNLRAWSPDVLEQILDSARGDVDRMQGFLDLGLSYTKLLQQLSLFSQPVPLIELLEKIIQRESFSSVKIHQLLPDTGEPVYVKMDQAMLKVALETLLREVVEWSPTGQQLDLRLSLGDGLVLLNLNSPRTLPLPGLATFDTKKMTFELSPELYLAKEILSAQGGNLVYEGHPPDEGGGLDIEVSLPTLSASQPRPSRQRWMDRVDKGTGRILLAENQPEYQLPVREALTDLGYRVDLAVDGSTVIDMIQARQPDLVILARNLPGMDGLLITQGVRRWSTVPIIMISMRDSGEDLLQAYKLGVDDYLQKPFLLDELLAKIQVFLSREEAARRSIMPEIYQEGSIRIDHGTREVWVRGDPVQLTPIEYNLLVYLSRQGRQIVPYEQLLEQVWEGPEKGTRQGLFVHVRRLRAKIELDPKNPKILINEWGVGYEFNP